MRIFVFFGALACPLSNQRAACQGNAALGLPGFALAFLVSSFPPWRLQEAVFLGRRVRSKQKLNWAPVLLETEELLTNWTFKMENKEAVETKSRCVPYRPWRLGQIYHARGVAWQSDPLWTSHWYLSSHHMGQSAPPLGMGHRAALRRGIQQESPLPFTLLPTYTCLTGRQLEATGHKSELEYSV